MSRKANHHHHGHGKKGSPRKPTERTPDRATRRRGTTLNMFVAQPSEELRNLYWAAEYGDTSGVETILRDHPNIDADAADAFGRTAIQIAVVNEHAEIVEILLDKSRPENIYEALLLAISHNYENITELILKHPTYRQFHYRWAEWAAKLPETSPFSDDISPIILACQKNLFGIVHLLWQEGMRVPQPHDFDCKCERCHLEIALPHSNRDQLKHAKRRLNEYRALTSEAYISLTSPDPFQTAFELSHQMERRAAQEKHFKREYKELVNQLGRYVVKLLDNVRTHHELQTILNCHSVNGQGSLATDNGTIEASFAPATNAATAPMGGLEHRRLSAAESVGNQTSFVKSEPLARLRVAIQFKQKEFVAHWSCQQELMRKWLRGFNEYQGASGQTKIFFNLFMIVLCYPALLFFHWIVPDSKPGQLISKPLVKFVAYSVSYLMFLGILCFITINPLGCYSEAVKLSQVPLGSVPITNETLSNLNSAIYNYCRTFCGDCDFAAAGKSGSPAVETVGELTAEGVLEICSFHKDFYVRPRGDNWMSWLASVWLLGLLFRKLFEIITRDVPNRLRQRWATLTRSPFDFIDYVVLAVFTGALIYRFFSYGKTFEAINFFADNINVSNETLDHFPKKLYWINADRFYFSPVDPLTMSELLFAVGAVFSFSRLLYIFPVLEVFGPCYLALMRVVNDIFAFFFVFLVVFAAFMIGTMNVYWYFNPSLRQMLQLNSSYDPQIPAEKRFGDMELTFRTVFWSLFGLGESDYMNLQNFANGSMIWVERIGYIMYGGYSVVVVCVLLNMLIAMMANSYEAIKINSETEWKFARTILFLEYIPDYSPTVPTPFNLIPNPRYIMLAIQRLYQQCRFNRRRRQSVMLSKSSTSQFYDDDALSPGSSFRQQPYKSESVFQLSNEDSDEPKQHDHQLIVGLPTSAVASPKFNDVIHKIVRRFIMGLTIQGSSGTVDLEEIKQDISSFRFEVLDIFANQQQQNLSRSNENLTVPQAYAGNKPDNRDTANRSPQPLLRRSIAPYRRRHLLASTNTGSLYRSNSSITHGENEKLATGNSSVPRLFASRNNSKPLNMPKDATPQQIPHTTLTVCFDADEDDEETVHQI